MPSIVRVGDQCTGDGCLPPRPNVGGSSNVFINGIGVHRMSDGWATHTCGNTVHSGAVQASGSGTVFANNLGVARVGDSISCGAADAQGSSDVFAG